MVNKPKRRLFSVLFLSNFILAGVLLLGLGWYMIDAIKELYHSVWFHHLEDTLEYADERLRTIPYDSLTEEFAQFRKSMRMRVTLMDHQGYVLFDTDTSITSMECHHDRPEFIGAMAGGRGQSIRFSRSVSKSMLYVAHRLDLPNKTVVLRMSTPLMGIERDLQRIYWKWGGIVAIVLLLAAILAYLVSWRVLAPIRILQEGAERFARGQLTGKIQLSSLEEVHSLGDSLNRMAREIDERIRSMALQKSETEAVLSSLMEGVVALDHQGAILRINSAAIRLFRLQSKPVHGRTLIEVVRNADLEYLLLLLHKGEDKILQRDVILVDGHSQKTLEARASALRDQQGVEIGSLLVFHDVTRIRQLEQMRSDFVANVSHELKTPITSIKGYVETLQDMPLAESPDAARFLDTVARHADRLNIIVDDLLTLSRIEQDGAGIEAEFQEVEMADLLESVLHIAKVSAEKNQIRLLCECPDGLWVNGNIGLLEQAILNLVVNGCKYSESGKTVRILVESTHDQADIHIRVSDQGFGIEQRHLTRIFERFYRVDKARSRHLGGTGLGLAITKHIILLHKGRIQVESEVGRGSVFTIELPRFLTEP